MRKYLLYRAYGTNKSDQDMDFRHLFSDTFISVTYLMLGILFDNFKSVLNVAFTFKPFYLGPCVFPGYFSFRVLYFPGIGYDNIAFMNPHSLLFRARDSAHADNSIHTLKRYPFRAK